MKSVIASRDKFTEGQREIAYFKRKRGILKKAMELSMICDQDIYMMIYDRKQGRVVEFQSTPNFSLDSVKDLLRQQEHKFAYELYENDDYGKINVKSLTKNQFCLL